MIRMLLSICLIVSVAHAQEVGFPDDAGHVDVTQPPFNAKGDGLADDTAAIQSAVAFALENSVRYGAPRPVYLPNGTYRLTDSIVNKVPIPPGKTDKLNGWRAGMFLIGQSREKTVLKLADNLPAFADKAKPRGVIVTGSEAEDTRQNAIGSGNRAFRHYLRNLTIDAGNNPGSAGIDYVVSNRGAITDVTLRGNGYAGVLMERHWPGPAMIARVQITGFDYGLSVATDQYSMTVEDLTVQQQRMAGVRIRSNALFIHGLTSLNAVPAVLAEQSGSGLVLIDANLTGGDPAASAIDAQGLLFARNVITAGYGVSIRDRREKEPREIKGNVGEYANRVISRGQASTSLNLPVEQSPRFDAGDLKQWASVADFGAQIARTWKDVKPGKDDTDAIQKAIDSGKPVVYLPNGVYFVSRPIVIRGNVRKIIGMGAQLDFVKGAKGDTMMRFDDIAGDSVELEMIRLNGALEHNSSKTLVVRHADLRDGYRNTDAGRGKLFIEDVTSKPLSLKNQQAWMRQINTEWMFEPWLQNHGGTLWVLGHKTEGKTHAIVTTGGGKSELLGGLYYRAKRWEGPDNAALFKVDAQSSLSATYVLNGEFYPEQLDLTGGPGVNLKEVTSPGRGPGLLRVGK